MLTYQIAESIHELDEKAWDALAGDEVVMSHRWQRVMEAGWQGYRARYALLRDRRGPLAAVVASLAQPFGCHNWVDRLLQRLTVALSAPFTSASCGISLRSGLALADVLPDLDRALGELARREKRLFVQIENVFATDLPAWQAQRFDCTSQAAVSVLDLPSGYEQYLQTLSAKNRSELRRMRRRADSLDVRFEHAPLAGEGEQVYQLLCEVFARHGTSLADMPFGVAWFDLMEREMPGEMMLFKGYVGSELAGVSPCILGQKKLWWPMVGLHYDLARPSYMYFLLMDEMIHWSIERGLQRIYGGLTSEREKSKHGFRLQARWSCHRAHPLALNRALRRLSPALRRLKALFVSSPRAGAKEGDRDQ